MYHSMYHSLFYPALSKLKLIKLHGTGGCAYVKDEDEAGTRSHPTVQLAFVREDGS